MCDMRAIDSLVESGSDRISQVFENRTDFFASSENILLKAGTLFMQSNAEIGSQKSAILKYTVVAG